MFPSGKSQDVLVVKPVSQIDLKTQGMGMPDPRQDFLQLGLFCRSIQGICIMSGVNLYVFSTG